MSRYADGRHKLMRYGKSFLICFKGEMERLLTIPYHPHWENIIYDYTSKNYSIICSLHVV
jgi:hypothetical protein